MTEVIDLASEARGALFEAVNAAAVAVGAAWAVYDTVPQGTQPPFLKIGAVDYSNEGRPSEQFERLNAELIGVYRGADRDELAAMIFVGRKAIDGKALATDVAAFPQCRFVSGSISDASKEDGVTYVALNTFELLGEPA